MRTIVCELMAAYVCTVLLLVEWKDIVYCFGSILVVLYSLIKPDSSLICIFMSSS